MPQVHKGDGVTPTTAKPCPFGCDNPRPHDRHGCVFPLSDAGRKELQRMLNDPQLMSLLKELPHAN